MAIKARTFHLLLIRAIKAPMRPNKGILHWAGRNLSFPVAPSSFLMEKDGRLLDIRRIFRVKKPWFCVENDG